MKNLLTKTLFISLLFSTITPAIQANGTVDSEIYSVEVSAPVGFFSTKVASLKDGAKSCFKGARFYVGKGTKAAGNWAKHSKTELKKMKRAYPVLHTYFAIAATTGMILCITRALGLGERFKDAKEWYAPIGRFVFSSH